MGVATAVFIVLMLLCTTFAVVAAVRAARAVNRGIERAGSQVRRTVDDTSLRIKAAQPGVVGQIARMRLEMRSSVDHARRELTEGCSSDASLREALGLLDQLHEHARVLDRELAGLMEREPDRARIAQRLPEVRERADEIRASADSLRLAAQERARRHDADGLASLREQIDIESGALRHWTSAAEAGPGASAAAGAFEPAAANGSEQHPPTDAPPPRPAVDPSAQDSAEAEGRGESSDARGKDAKWDAGGLWQARSQLLGFGRGKRTRNSG